MWTMVCSDSLAEPHARVGWVAGYGKFVGVYLVIPHKPIAGRSLLLSFVFKKRCMDSKGKWQ